MQLTREQNTGGIRVIQRPRMTKTLAFVLVVGSLLIIFELDRATGAAPVQHLYYLPIILAALRLEWVGGLLASLSAIVLYHLANPALLTFAYRESDLVQIALFIAVGLATARLAE